ncbi:hypothetical protein ANO11243_010010 [Dothideomycetidae sp. 11243]|nr:hypothetical protein ANO11243_010010 [fungal sp. No.11243]
MLPSLLLFAAVSVSAAVLPDQSPASSLVERSLLSSYAPTLTTCPSTSLNRVASSINPSEAAYIASRQNKARPALASWIKSVDSTFDTSVLPIVAFAASGGGYRAMLQAAGVVQAFDSRDSSTTTSGLFQGLSYFGGLSGGSWLLSSLAGNNWPTVSSLYKSKWATALADTVLLPGGIFSAPFDLLQIDLDLKAKTTAGYPTTIPDVWGRLISFQLLSGSDGGVTDRLSGLSRLTNFASFSMPFPYMTSIGVTPGVCAGQFNGTQYEFTPYEFGSWDAGINAFTQSAYLGTSMNNGKPSSGRCITNFDNLGYIFGTSSDYYGGVCEETNGFQIQSIPAVLTALIKLLKGVVTDTYASYPNPFYNSASSPLVSAQSQLKLTDGGISGQNDPIWPLLQPSRNVSVIIISDNSADTKYNMPDGREIYHTYQRALQTGLTKMPPVPPQTTFVAQGLTSRATFFGCNTTDTVTLVWLPNVNYIAGTNTSTTKFEYSKAASASLIANGNKIATQNGDAKWPTCLACAIQKKTGTTLPAGCAACFANSYPAVLQPFEIAAFRQILIPTQLGRLEEVVAHFGAVPPFGITAGRLSVHDTG